MNLLETFLTGVNGFDAGIMAFVQERLRTPFGDAVFPYITYLAQLGFLWILVSLVLLARKKTRLTGAIVLLAMGLGLLFGEILLKTLVARPRPFQQFPDVVSLLVSAPHGGSFPSGHTSSSFAAAMAVFLWRKKWGVPALIVAALIGFSRVYLYLHWPTDVLAGALLGVAFALLVHILLHRLVRKSPRLAALAPED